MAGVGDDGRADYRINGHGHLHLLRKFEAEEDDDEDAGGVKLSLNLSMGGRFGVDPVEKKRLLRSSSIGGLASLPIFDDLIEKKEVVAVAGVVGGGGGGGNGGFVPLGRTVSLPVQTEEDLRRRKEMQMLRRLEAKRKRSEKQKNSCSGRQVPAAKECRGDDATSTSSKSKVLPPTSGRFWPGSAAAPTPACSQGSVSSGTSDVDGRSVVTATATTGKDSVMMEAKTPTSTPRRLSSLPTSPARDESEGMERRMIGEMPSVTTTGTGPNGRRVEGFLYRYRKGEEVSIVCVCHGTFFTPAEFVRHAGGGDVAHPLRHITVTPTTT